jgi:hypothetical protein
MKQTSFQYHETDKFTLNEFSEWEIVDGNTPRRIEAAEFDALRTPPTDAKQVEDTPPWQ